MSNDTTTSTATKAGRHIDTEATELDAITRERASAYGPAWRERFATRHHLHNSIGS